MTEVLDKEGLEHLLTSLKSKKWDTAKTADTATKATNAEIHLATQLTGVNIDDYSGVDYAGHAYYGMGEHGCTGGPSDCGTDAFGLLIIRTAGGCLIQLWCCANKDAVYYRRHNGGWTEWKLLGPQTRVAEATVADTATKAVFYEPSNLGGPLDFNTLKTQGVRRYQAIGEEKAFTNIPPGYSATDCHFWLIVLPHVTEWVVQIAIDIRSGRTFVRTCQANNWKPWVELYSTSVLESKFDDLLKSHIETIRTALGVATTAKDGLMPKLPENSEV